MTSVKRTSQLVGVIVALGLLVLFWSYFIERNIIIIREEVIETGFEAKIGLIADFHLGQWKDEEFLERVVNKVNNLELDYVFIAGDFTYKISGDEIERMFNPLSDLNIPTYAVLGNHDTIDLTIIERNELERVIVENNVILLNNNLVELDSFRLVGLGSAMSGEDDVSLINGDLNSKVIVLTHNPDTVLKYDRDVDLTLTGHTHCGQVRIPFLYKLMIPTFGNFDKGLSNEEMTKLYITCGLGEVGVPLRLFNPPVIDVLILT